MSGRLAISNASQVCNEILSILEMAPGGLVVDLSDVQVADTPALRMLLFVVRVAERHQRPLLLIDPPAKIVRVLEVTGSDPKLIRVQR